MVNFMFRILSVAPDASHPVRDYEAENRKAAVATHESEHPDELIVNAVYIPYFEYKPLSNPYLTNWTLTPELLHAQGWQDDYAHSVRLHELNNTLSQPHYRLLLNAISSGLPIVIKRRTSDAMIDEHTVMVESLTFFGKESSAATIRVRYWGGFNHDVYLPNIISLDTPDYKIEKV